VFLFLSCLFSRAACASAYSAILLPILGIHYETNVSLCDDLVPPRWIVEPTDRAFAQGSDARIECKSDGFPKPTVTWKKAAG